MVYINNNPNFILSEMGGHFGMSAPGALYWPCKLDSAIKKTSPMWKQTKRNEMPSKKS